MDDALFDGLSRSLASSGSRRTILTVLATSALTGFRDRAEANRKKKKRKKPKPAPSLAAPPPAHTVPPCIPDNSTACAGKQCGVVVNTCGQPFICGDCIEPATCQNGQCAPCVPNCTGKRCGPNGCGGSCGRCAAPETCLDGICGCVPNCSSKACGPDGCGASCGTCGRGDVCREDGQCVGSACGIGAKICTPGSDAGCCVAGLKCCPAGSGVDGCCEPKETCCPDDSGCCDTQFLVCCPGGMGCCSKTFSVCCPELNRCCPNGSQCGTSPQNPCLTASAGLRREARTQGIAPLPRRQRGDARPDEHTTASPHVPRHGQ
jgi:hypothetical protein